jgi:hypothetical protein
MFESATNEAECILGRENAIKLAKFVIALNN